MGKISLATVTYLSGFSQLPRSSEHGVHRIWFSTMHSASLSTDDFWGNRYRLVSVVVGGLTLSRE
jgi:hypothetical protein